MEPALSEEVVGALYAPTSAITDPFLMTVALAENAAENGVSFRFLTKVQEIRRAEDGFEITVASEVMAILCLARDIKDLKARLGNIIVGYNTIAFLSSEFDRKIKQRFIFRIGDH